MGPPAAAAPRATGANAGWPPGRLPWRRYPSPAQPGDGGRGDDDGQHQPQRAGTAPSVRTPRCTRPTGSVKIVRLAGRLCPDQVRPALSLIGRHGVRVAGQLQGGGPVSDSGSEVGAGPCGQVLQAEVRCRQAGDRRTPSPAGQRSGGGQQLRPYSREDDVDVDDKSPSFQVRSM